MEPFLVVSLTNHRLDVMLANWFCCALYELHIPYTTNVYSSYNKAIVFNGVLTKDSQVYLDIINKRAEEVFYMVDDCDLEIPDSVTIVTQFFNNSGAIFFNIASLAIMDYKWNSPLINTKMISNIYGGTFKPRRDYSIIPDIDTTIILGDDDRWDKIFHNAVILPKIRDMDLFYGLLSISKDTYIVSDILHDNINVPLRLFECVFANTNCIMYTGETLTPMDIKQLYTKKDLLRNIECLIQQM